MNLRHLLAELPDTALLPVGFLREQLEADAGDRDDVLVDLTCEEAGQLVGRAASTVRSWCVSGRLVGCYKMAGREWRVPPDALRSLRDRDGAVDRAQESNIEAVDLGSWRAVR